MANIDLDHIKVSISIEDVLNFYGIPFKGNRCKCPVHQGDNPTSFSFTDEVFCCHSCGAKGDVIALVQQMEDVGFKESLRRIADLAGVNIDDIPPGQKRDRDNLPKSRREPEHISISIQRGFRDILYEWQAEASRELRELPGLLRAGKIGLGDFYLRQQILDYRMDDIDRGITALTHKIKTMEREARNEYRNRNRTHLCA